MRYSFFGVDEINRLKHLREMTFKAVHDGFVNFINQNFLHFLLLLLIIVRFQFIFLVFIQQKIVFQRVIQL